MPEETNGVCGFLLPSPSGQPLIAQVCQTGSVLYVVWKLVNGPAFCCKTESLNGDISSQKLAWGKFHGRCLGNVVPNTNELFRHAFGRFLKFV
jgi:hypothetical protein